jgi:hypothetical protein
MATSTPNTSEADIYMTDNSDKNITLDIKIGPAGQKAASHVKLEQDLLLKDHDGTLKNFVIDTNMQCKNKFLGAATVVTAMADVDSLRVDYVLKGGPEGPKTISLTSGAVKKGEAKLFDITVFLF